MKDKLLKIEKMLFDIPKKIKELSNDTIEHLITITNKSKDLAKTNFELGLFHLDKGNINDAIIRFYFTIKLKADHAPAHYHLARCYLIKQNYEKAELELKKALLCDPNFTLAQYRLDSLQHSLNTKYIPIEIIREDFNSIADNYEYFMLEMQEYHAPEDLANMLASFIESRDIPNDEGISCLDLGCGTGLVGASLVEKVTVKSLIGIDISRNMLELAKKLEINQEPVYHETLEKDFNHLELEDKKFDLITSCLSFGYDSDLVKVFNNLDLLSNSGTLLGLVVLNATSSEDFEFNYKYECFGYNNNYIKSIFEKYNWNVVEEEELALFFDNTIGSMFLLVKK